MYGPPALSPPIGVPRPSAASAPKANPDPQVATAAALQAAAAAGFLPLGGAEGVPSAFYPPGVSCLGLSPISLSLTLLFLPYSFSISIF